MADLSLADSMNASEPLLNPVGIPRQIVIDHQVCALKVNTLASCVGGKKNLNFWIVPKGFLRLHPLFAAHATVDQDHCVFPA